MIFVDRTKVTPPAALVADDSAGKKEIAKALDFYKKALVKFEAKVKAFEALPADKKKRAKAPKAPNFDFEAYREKEVKEQLAVLFHRKCAYCESYYAPVMTGDVEHFRPKGRIKASETGKALWPGYYWLALTWENLLPSCAICNQKNTMVDLAHGAPRTLGKVDWFPLEDEQQRAKPGGDVSKESPLLIDPCVEQPETHFEFVERDTHRALLSGKTKKGMTTAHILGLNRTDLVVARQKKLACLEALMTEIQGLSGILVLVKGQSAAEDRLLEAIRLKVVTLTDFMKPESDYSALARQEVPKFLAKMSALTPPAAT